ncbi:hypothetical protein RB614_24040 [Phytohabitans sp. ZYX-F-186]|uniref:Uncharacterized protein n=1 Tax=Phytohabitans maris TaxID=3071409 RepID=A0ABU0ZLW9_9ACTN|nr:hypothetical protein [Phytohabitans sp. ZYX-F-186]MDQ7907596.1 hypothetical protein [Phytohabitans sp. ZYX-F-186]
MPYDAGHHTSVVPADCDHALARVLGAASPIERAYDSIVTGERVLLSLGPAAGGVVVAVGPTVVVGAHLYEATAHRAEAEWGRWRPVYRPATDCCDPHGGDADGCE